MKKEKSDSLAAGICIGVAFGIIFDNLALGIAIGAGLGATGVFSTKKKKRNSQKK